MKRASKELNMDGRAVAGHVRKTLGIGVIYKAIDMRSVKNVIRNLLGEGLHIVKDEATAE